MLGWLKRKPPPVPGEPSRKSEDAPASGEERLERLLGRLGSETVGGGDHAAAAVLERQAPRRPPAPPPMPVPPSPAAGRTAPDDDPEEAVLSEIFPPAAVVEPQPAEPPAAEPANAVEAVVAPAAADGDGDRIVADDARAEPAAEPTPVEAPEALAPIAVTTEPELPHEAAAVGDAATGGEPTMPVGEIAPAPDGADAADDADDADDEPVPAARPAAKSPRRRAVRKPAAVEPLPSGDVRPPAEIIGGFPPMFVIAVASQKGGAGKTTLAAHLAVRAGIAGQGPVVLIDTDPQGSLAEWWHARQDDTPALAVVKPEQLGANLAELRSYGTAVAIIDTPPALTGSIEQVIAMSDLIVIPVRPSPHDLRAAGGTVAMAQRAGKPFIFVVNGASPRASITAQAVAALSEHGRVAPVILYQRTEFAASMIDGRTVMEAAASGRSAQEIAELWQCVYAQIGMRAAA